MSTLPNKKFFSETDWKKIVALCEEIRPLAIERSNGGAICIYGKRIKTDTGWVSTSLEYFHNESTSAIYSKEGLEHLDGYWYINECTSDF
ncbi:MAG: hypothetical protein FWF10_12125 [Clostridiales bacterium]|nr:hypothetical protein [Clostridiales bacterium]